jgi:hypothetical protein
LSWELAQISPFQRHLPESNPSGVQLDKFKGIRPFASRLGLVGWLSTFYHYQLKYSGPSVNIAGLKWSFFGPSNGRWNRHLVGTKTKNYMGNSLQNMFSLHRD